MWSTPRNRRFNNWQELLLLLDNELSNSTCNKVRKIIRNRNISLKSRHALNQNETTCEGFTIKWKDTELINNGRTISVYSENYGCKISYINGIQSFAKRDFDSYNVKHDNDDEHVVIVNSCDGVVHPVTRHCDRTMLTQSISILSEHIIN